MFCLYLLQDDIGPLATLHEGLLAILVAAVEATHLIVADLIPLAIGGAGDHCPTHPTIGVADLTLIRDLHHLMIVTTGDVTDQSHLTTDGGTGTGTGPGPGHTRLTTEHGTDHTHLTTGGGIGLGPGHTRLTTEHVTDHTHLTTGEETGPIRLITEGVTHLKVVTIKGMAGQYIKRL